MTALQQIENWFSDKKWKAFPFQKQTWIAYLNGKDGMLNAPTGSGKTYAVGLGILAEYLKNRDSKDHQTGIQAIWITPIRALAKEIESALSVACTELDIPWEVAKRTGDTSTKERAKQKKNLPQILITTPESLQLLLASKGYQNQFKTLKCIVNDEWHELLGTKRAVQMELAQSRLKRVCPKLKIWGISATIGNMEESIEVLLGDDFLHKNHELVIANIKKRIEVKTLIPNEVEKFPWAGHLGIKMLKQVIPVIQKSKTALIFTNTRSQCEIWYQRLLEEEPDLAGQIAMHHGSIGKELREWVEDSLHAEKLKAVVCTSSLDLGVDFRPVETIVQIGSPKGVSRFLQRAGRSGHQPGAMSRIYFVPTHSLELIESAALIQAIKEGALERRIPYFRSFDVLIQYLVTLAISDGFKPEEIYPEIKSTFSFSSISDEEWLWVLQFIVNGGDSLDNYDEYKKVIIDEEGVYRVVDRTIATRHRLSMGTIVSEPDIKITFMSGKYIGTVEEYFVASLKQGTVFWFAGRNLEFIQLKGTNAIVKLSKEKNGRVPSWKGSRMALSSQLSAMLRTKIMESQTIPESQIELQSVAPLIQKQAERSHVPAENEFLIESFESKEGFHCYFYPFEGRFVHEGLASVIGYRISLLTPISFSIALNDYGFELLSDQPIPIESALDNNIFSEEHLFDDIQASINSTEMARRKFRDIASISGLVFRGFPGKNKKDKHIQASSQLFFDVFADYEKHNLLYLQAFEEVMAFQLEETRMREAMQRIANQTIVLKYIAKPSPFSFPIMVDRLNREKLSSEKLEDKIRKMKLDFE
ncbi:MAG: ATP-dependent Lhr-like helicase [Vicingaceae bacterium]|jgi:ATP-dependent Lhr-like helicase